MDAWAFEQLRPWLAARVELPVGPWYERLLGAKSFLAHATEAVWTLADEPVPASALQYADGRTSRR